MPPQRFCEFRIRRVSITAKDAPRRPTGDLESAEEVARFLRRKLLHDDREHFFVIHYNVQTLPIAYDLAAIGQLGAVEIHPREVFKGAIINSSAGILLAHNHPSGTVTPSDDDDELTRRMISAGDLLGIQVIDHIVFTSRNVYSYREHDRVFITKAKEL